MKTLRFLSVTILAACLCACTNTWDEHYAQKDDEVNGSDVQSVATTVAEYMKSESSLSTMYALFNETGIIEAMGQKEQPYTLLAVPDGVIGNVVNDAEDKMYMAKTHISDIAISPSNLTNGQRILMWNGKYLEITKEVAANGSVTAIYFNGVKVTRIIKATNGFIYELEGYANAPKSMYELIAGLGDDYSIFREMVMSRNVNAFDKEASIPVGVDNTGRTVYDSIFVVTNPYFTAQGFDLMSESLTATMLIPSNTIINNAISKAKADLQGWNMNRADSVISNWVFQAAFFNKKYSKEDFVANVDLTSIFKKQWRTTMQQVDLDNPVDMSNGVAYYVSWMKIPINVLIYRLKDYFHWYENLTLDDKAKFYVETNLTFDKCNTDVAAWSGWPGHFPNIINRVLIYNLTDQTNVSNSLEFTPFNYTDNGNGTYTAVSYKVPPGEYDLCLGFKQNLKNDIKVSFNGTVVNTISTSTLTATTYHYDRGGQGYPEGYDTALATDSKKGNYDRDGGKVGVVTITGSEPKEIKITFDCTSTASEGSRNMIFHHWCLRPTTNCY